MKCYSVTKWDEFFENNRTKGMVQMRWVPIPNKHDGDGFTDLIGRPNGMALYGAWILILQVASKCDKRGVLMKSNGAPHTAASISRQSRGNEKAIEQALLVLVEIGWLECKECNINSDEGLSNPAVCPQSSRSLPAVFPHVVDEGKEWNGMEEKGKQHAPDGDVAFPSNLQTTEFREAWAAWEKHRTEIRKPLKPTMKAEQLKQLSTWGATKAVLSLRKSIQNGWQGIFEPDQKQTATATALPPLIGQKPDAYERVRQRQLEEAKKEYLAKQRRHESTPKPIGEIAT